MELTYIYIIYEIQILKDMKYKLKGQIRVRFLEIKFSIV